MTLEERAQQIRSCKWVDEVVENVPFHPTFALLDALNCQFVGHGDDMIYTEDGSNAYQEFHDAGRMKVFKRT